MENPFSLVIFKHHFTSASSILLSKKNDQTTTTTKIWPLNKQTQRNDKCFHECHQSNEKKHLLLKFFFFETWNICFRITLQQQYCCVVLLPLVNQPKKNLWRGKKPMDDKRSKQKKKKMIGINRCWKLVFHKLWIFFLVFFFSGFLLLARKIISNNNNKKKTLLLSVSQFSYSLMGHTLSRQKKKSKNFWKWKYIKES